MDGQGSAKTRVLSKDTQCSAAPLLDPIRFSGVTVRYGEAIALEDVSFVVPPACVVGLLGSNGAGKTSAIRVLLGHLRPAAGTATLFGMPLRERCDVVRWLGAVTESIGLEPKLSVRNTLLAAAAAAGLPRTRVEQVLEETGSVAFATKEIRTLSTGMRQRVALALGLIGDPPVLVLDEPLAGLD